MRRMSLTVEDLQDLQAGHSINVEDSNGYELIVAADDVHVESTGCGLTWEDFHPDGDESCPDGGRPEDHPVSTVETGKPEVYAASIFPANDTARAYYVTEEE